MILFLSFLDNGVMTTPKRRILSFVFTVSCFKKSKIGFLNPKDSETDFASLYYTDQSKITRTMVRRRNRRRKYSSVFLTHHDLRDLEMICLVKKTQNSFSDSFEFNDPILHFLTETHSKI